MLHPYTSTISSLETEVLQTLPLRTFLSQILTQTVHFPQCGWRVSHITFSNGASVKIVPRHCAAPYSGVINRLFFPIHPNPASKAIVLFGKRDSLCAASNFPSAIRFSSDCEKRCILFLLYTLPCYLPIYESCFR